VKPRSYATPLAFKTAVEQRLRNEAAVSEMDLQRRRQLFVFDRFLARLFHVLDDAVVLKGGLVIELRLERARTTGAVLRAAIDRTFENRATHPAPASVPEPPAAWAPVYARIAANDGLTWRTTEEVTDTVRSFLDPVLGGSMGIWGATNVSGGSR
jgi:hypothetical protein